MRGKAINRLFLFLRACCLICCLFCLQAGYTQEGKPSTRTTSTPEQFFRVLAQSSNSTPPPSYDEVLKVVDQIPGQGADQAKAALIPIVAALSSPNDEIKKDAALALTVVGRRRDGQELLGPYINRIDGLLDESNDRLQVGGRLYPRNVGAH